MDGLGNDAGATLASPQTAPPLAFPKYVVGQTLGPSDKVTWLDPFPGAGWQADHIAGCCVKSGPNDKGQGFPESCSCLFVAMAARSQALRGRVLLRPS